MYIGGFRLPNFVDYANELLFWCPWHLNEPGCIISSTGKFGLRLEPRPFCSKRHTYRCSCRRAIKRHYSDVIVPPTGMGIVISASQNFSAIKQIDSDLDKVKILIVPHNMPFSPVGSSKTLEHGNMLRSVNTARNGGEILIYGYCSIKSGRRDFRYKL